MKKLLLIILLLFTFTCKGQNSTWLTLNFDYLPDNIVDISDVRTEVGMKYGQDFLKAVGFVKLNNRFDEFWFGAGGELTCLKIGENIDVLFNGGFSFLVDQVPADKFHTEYHPYDIYYGLRFENKVSNHFALAVYLQNQFYGQEDLKVFGAGITYK